jgi:hypothetical protein
MTGQGLPSDSDWTYPRDVGTPAALASGSANAVRLSPPAIEAIRELPKSQATAVAEAIRRIGPDQGTPLKIPPGKGGGQFLAIVPDEADAPVVIYRKLTPDEGEGYLVTAIVEREEYEGYQRAEREGILDTPLGRLLLGVAAGAAAYALVRSTRAPVR